MRVVESVGVTKHDDALLPRVRALRSGDLTVEPGKSRWLRKKRTQHEVANEGIFA